jgi:hypothetical protein
MSDGNDINELLLKTYYKYDEELNDLNELENLLNEVKTKYEEVGQCSTTVNRKGSISSDIDDGYKSGNSSISDKSYMLFNNSVNSIKNNSKRTYQSKNSVTIDLVGTAKPIMKKK